MFLLKKITAKLKSRLKCRAVLNPWTVSGCLLVAAWLAWGPLRPLRRESRAAPGRGTGEPDAIPKHLRKYLRYSEGYTIPAVEVTDSELDDLRQIIERTNLNPVVRNSIKYGAVSANTTVIVVQVHRAAERLQHLIVSLAQVRSIQNVLLVFSHSCHDAGLTALVLSVSFCRVMQIYYPFSLQLHPDSYPGVDPADGFNRDARLSERKLHWWWNAHYIFSLRNTSPERLVIFLEEDDYVLPDLLYVVPYLKRLQSYSPSAEVMALGKPYAEGADYSAILLDSWSSKYDRGLAFNVSSWARIGARAAHFCRHNDWRWSRSLAQVFAVPPGAGVAAVAAARVLRPGGAAAERRARRARLFPRRVRVLAGARWLRPAPQRALGGWGDARDRTLCLDILRTNTSDPSSNSYADIHLRNHLLYT